MTGQNIAQTCGTPERIGERLGQLFLISLMAYLVLGLTGFLR